ncbi:zinc-ribbon domain containing protein [Alkalihalobacillus sp. 1P02AB]|uniref:zinc-ribbon domain containing protein n=1 Tax=Alkalihalobacillus sp. 1P02AB TaxID=3132260 RepID=UPI0039A5F6CD
MRRAYLAGLAPHDLLLKCWECGNRFIFTAGEQQFFKRKGFSYPKRCKKCRNEYDDVI